jgi:hypothetical protein
MERREHARRRSSLLRKSTQKHKAPFRQSNSRQAPPRRCAGPGCRARRIWSHLRFAWRRGRPAGRDRFIIFAHSSARRSSRNWDVARLLNRERWETLLVDLLTGDKERIRDVAITPATFGQGDPPRHTGGHQVRSRISTQLALHRRTPSP